MINNYAKPSGRHGRVHRIFFFDDADPESTQAALEAAREVNPRGGSVAVYRQLKPMRDGVLCVGHSPVDVRQHADGGKDWSCVNCGQRGTTR